MKGIVYLWIQMIWEETLGVMRCVCNEKKWKIHFKSITIRVEVDFIFLQIRTRDSYFLFFFLFSKST